MAHNTSINLDVTLNADGYSLGGGVTSKRALTISGGNVTVAGNATGLVFTMPSATSTLVGDVTSQTLTNKTFTGPVFSANTTTVPSFTITSSSAVEVSSPTTGQAWYDGTYLYFKDNVSGYTKRVNKRQLVVTLISGTTPATGAQLFEYVIPYHTDGSTSITWNVRRMNLRVGTAGGAPAAKTEVSTVTTAFTATTIGTVTLTSGANEGSITSGFTTTTVASGNKIRLNVTSLATATSWTVTLELEEA